MVLPSPAALTGRGLLVFALLPSAATSCSRSAPNGGAIFTDVTPASGIVFQLTTGANGQRTVLETMPGGVGWIDYDGDGDYDLYLANGHSDLDHADLEGSEEDRLYRNEGGGRFTDVTAAARIRERRYSLGVAVADYDNDGDSDLLVTNFGRNTLWQNGGDGTFADVAESAGIVQTGFHSSAAWLDMDRDGDLDLYIARYIRYHPRTSRRCSEKGVPITCRPQFFAGEGDLLYENLGGGGFREVGKRAGIALGGENDGKGLGVVAFDFDRDGWTDLYVANDTTPNFLFRNNGDGTFTDVAQAVGCALGREGHAHAGMGVDVADVNGDGLTDIYVTNFSNELNSLFLGAKGAQFVESSRRANLGATFLPLGFGTLFADVDLDGDQDIVTANGHINEAVETTEPGTGAAYRQPAELFLNRGDGLFDPAPERGGAFFSLPCVARGLGRADMDGDGDIDLAFTTLDRSLVLLRNENPARARSVTLRLVGTRSPRDPFGARVEAEVAGRLQVFEYGSARSYLSASDPRVVVALGSASRVDRLTIHWPSGRKQELRSVEGKGVVTVREPEE